MTPDTATAAPVWTLPPDLQAPARARHLVAGQLHVWHLDQIADDALLIVSELVSNAIRLGQTVLLALKAVADAGRRMLRIEVTDPGPGPAATTPALPGDEAEHGRGLPIVDILTDSWGCDRDPDRTLVWAQLPLPSAAASPALA
ncbi:ATP-binding protein [Streptacidiphilus rugosus]|uniref:ATP-binding protein n=1 Tax=Streptacidiphilus rugosus TaxID=405783 RepID=UPI000689D33A|nr:ATP-binding protein [Streptacidiphilus rugosus]